MTYDKILSINRTHIPMYLPTFHCTKYIANLQNYQQNLKQNKDMPSTDRLEIFSIVLCMRFVIKPKPVMYLYVGNLLKKSLYQISYFQLSGPQVHVKNYQPWRVEPLPCKH